MDSFQGRESAVVIVDMVAAKEGLRKAREEEPDEDVEDVGTEDYIKVGAVTNHVRDPSRLNVALTRGKDGTIVVCQAALLTSTFKAGRTKVTNALSNMIGDAASRKLLVDDHRDDSHPASVKGRADKSTTKLRMEQEKQQEVDLGFIADGVRRWNAMRYNPGLPEAEPVKYYRTPTGHTTRPIGDPKLAAEADAYDEQMQLEQAKDASKVTEANREENERNLRLGVQEFLGLPEQPSTTDTAMEVESQGNGGGAEAGEDSDVEEEMEEEIEVADAYKDVDAGGGEDQFE